MSWFWVSSKEQLSGLQSKNDHALVVVAAAAAKFDFFRSQKNNNRRIASALYKQFVSADFESTFYDLSEVFFSLLRSQQPRVLA